jgi:hypothetical protein
MTGAQAGVLKMNEHTNETLNEVTDPKTRGKLTGLQEVVFDVDAEVNRLQQAINAQKALVDASEAIAKRMKDEYKVITAKMDNDEIDHREAKVRMDQAKKMVKAINDAKAESEKDLAKMEGQMVGLRKASGYGAKRFEDAKLKWERQKRTFEEDEEDELRSEPKKKPRKTAKKKTAKKKAKK